MFLFHKYWQRGYYDYLTITLLYLKVVVDINVVKWDLWGFKTFTFIWGSIKILKIFKNFFKKDQQFTATSTCSWTCTQFLGATLQHRSNLVRLPNGINITTGCGFLAHAKEKVAIAHQVEACLALNLQNILWFQIIWNYRFNVRW